MSLHLFHVMWHDLISVSSFQNQKKILTHSGRAPQGSKCINMFTLYTPVLSVDVTTAPDTIPVSFTSL
jgi:hypothetical protein